jgi:hypothetical protein
MDPSRFDDLARSVVAGAPSRRLLLQTLAGGLATGFAITSVAEAKHKHKHHHKKKKCKGGCDANFVCNKGKCQVAPDRCTALSVCGEDPTPCGTTAGGGDCSCETTTEGNSACINFIDTCDDFPQECTTTQDCEDTVGFHFFCQAIKACGCTMATGRCLPECDNPNP